MVHLERDVGGGPGGKVELGEGEVLVATLGQIMKEDKVDEKTLERLQQQNNQGFNFEKESPESLEKSVDVENVFDESIEQIV